MAKKKPQVDRATLERAGVVVDAIERLTEERKKMYAEHDALAVTLEHAPEATLLAAGLAMERPFDGGNTQWGHGPVRRLKLVRAKGGKAAK